MALRFHPPGMAGRNLAVPESAEFERFFCAAPPPRWLPWLIVGSHGCAIAVLWLSPIHDLQRVALAFAVVVHALSWLETGWWQQGERAVIGFGVHGGQWFLHTATGVRVQCEPPAAETGRFAIWLRFRGLQTARYDALVARSTVDAACWRRLRVLLHLGAPGAGKPGSGLDAE